ncbi:MAG: hypothetical protein CMJ83_00880 [Planctomycetes bacterium]|nr:hypothetical protein [Planctomycetota bacterium]
MFGVPAMLFWGGAASIPILIHLFTRQRYKKVPWAAMEFLLRAFKKTRKRIRLEQLLLLLLRILAILLFVLALADPIMSPDFVPGLDQRRELVIMLDDSFSMGLKEPDGGTPFDRAKNLARKLLTGLQQERGDTVTIVTAGKPARLALKGVSDLETAMKTIEEVEVGAGATDYLGAFRATVAALDDLQKGAEVLILSDLQKIGFSPPSEGAAEGEAPPDVPQQLLSSLVSEMRARKAVVSVVAPKETNTDNLAIVRLEKRSKVVVTGTAAVVTATVRNFGTRPQGGIVRLHVDGGSQPVDFRTVDVIPAGGLHSVDFRHTFRTEGSHFVEARFLTDNLEADNRRALALEVRKKIKTLVVDGDPSQEPGEQESFFFEAAMSPGGDNADENEFDVEVVQEIVFERRELKDVDLLVLMDVALISSRRADEIHRFVEEGGGLLVFLGNHAEKPATLNQRLWKGGSGVLPAKILGAAGEDALAVIPYNISRPDVDHPALAYFSDPAIKPLLTVVPPIYRYFQTEIKADDPSVRILAWLDRPKATLAKPDPFILEKTTGKGKTILIASSGGDPDWNDIHVFPTYLVLAREFGYYLTRREERLENLTVGQSYQRVLKSFVREVILSHDGGQISVLKPLALEGDRGHELKTGPLRKSGVYRLDLQRQPDQELQDPNPIHVAVNVDPVESDLTRVDEGYISASFPGDAIKVIHDIDQAEEASTAARDGRVWWWALLLGAIVLALETALAQIFGLRAKGVS